MHDQIVLPLISTLASIKHFLTVTTQAYLANKSSSYTLVVKSEIKILILMKRGWIFLTVVDIICNRPNNYHNVRICKKYIHTCTCAVI